MFTKTKLAHKRVHCNFGPHWILCILSNKVDYANTVSDYCAGIMCSQVMRKADAPPGFLASIQQAGGSMPVQPWKSPPLKKVSTPKATGYHLQWKRDQSVLEKSPASCATN